MFRPGKLGSVYSEGHDRMTTQPSPLLQALLVRKLSWKKKTNLLFMSAIAFSLLWNLLIQSILENECY